MGKKQHDRHVKWDEAEIERHSSLRGTRQRIDHPDTPFLYYNSHGGSRGGEELKESSLDGPQVVDIGTIQQRLGLVKTMQEAEQHWLESAEEETVPAKKTLFEMKRNALMSEQSKVLLDILSGSLTFEDEEEEDK